MPVARVPLGLQSARAGRAVEEALLVYNPNAGGSPENQSAELQRGLEIAGYHPVYMATERENDLDDILPQAKGLIVVVGGDGTLRAVVTRMLSMGLTNPIAIVPNGTANNVGHTLGVTGDPADIVAALAHPMARSFDLGQVSTPWDKHYFLEGAGFGLFAECLFRYKPSNGKSVWRGLNILTEVLSDIPDISTRLRFDGREEEGDYILLEALNTKAVGPRLGIAEEADPGDGLLELARIRSEDRESLLTYSLALATGAVHDCQSVRVDRVRKVEFLWDDFPLHFDGEYALPHAAFPSEIWVELSLLPKRLEFWAPSPMEASGDA